MKKRCTNSACRKIFAVNSVCPHCGKEYPRLPAVQIRLDVVLISFTTGKVIALKRLHDITGMSINEGKAVIWGETSIIRKGVSEEEGKALKKRLKAVGIIAEVRKTVLR